MKLKSQVNEKQSESPNTPVYRPSLQHPHREQLQKSHAHDIRFVWVLIICNNLYKLLLDPVCVHQKSSKREPEREIFDRSMIENLQVFTGQFFPSKNLQAQTADF